MKKLTDEQVQGIRNWGKSAKEASEKLTVVLNGIKRQLSKEKGSNEIAKLIDAHWKEFVAEFMHQMPHVVWNGSKQAVVCEWVESKDDKPKKAFRQYRYFGEEISYPTNAAGEIEAVGSIEREIEKTAKEVITFASGWSMEVPSRDSDGNVQKTKVCTKLVPREKNVWGYTDTVIDAFIAAADKLATVFTEE